MTRPRQSAEADSTPSPLKPAAHHLCQRCAERIAPVRFDAGLGFRARWCDECRCTWGNGQCQMLATIFFGRGLCQWHDWCRDSPQDAGRVEVFSHWLVGWKQQYGSRQTFQRSVWALATEGQLVKMVGGLR